MAGMIRIAGLFVLLLSVGTLPAAGSAQQSGAAPLQTVAGSLFTELASIRGLSTPGAPPPVVIRSRSEIRRYTEQELNRKYPAARIEAERKAMVAWGVIAPDFDLRGSLLDLLQEQAAAYYDPVGRVMVLADWLTPEEQQLALLHELVHALQDREISLDRFLAPTPGKGDQLLARQAVIEGEATALSLDLLLQRQGLNLTRLSISPLIQQLAGALFSGPVFARVPKFLQQLLLFPYLQGAAFVQEVRLQHPWAAMSQLYRDPPRSTTQILHPEKFLGRREDPLPITLPDLRPILAPAGRLVTEDELGEWGLALVLETFLDQASGARLTNGWRGDRYQLWEDDRGQLGLIYRVRWEAEGPAEAFAQAYAGLFEKKHPSLAAKAMKGPGSLWSWQEGSRSFLVERQKLEVLVLERIPASALEPIRQKLW
jgi:hypothetical protein